MTPEEIARELQALICERSAVDAEMEGIKSENQALLNYGFPPSHNRGSFLVLADRYSVLSAKFRNLGK